MWSVISSLVCLVYNVDKKSVMAATTCTTINCYDGIDVYTTSHCAVAASDACYKIEGSAHDHKIQTCITCKSGYTKICDNPVCDNVQRCTCKCQCSNCTSTGNWTAKGTGYEQRVGKGCDCSSGTATCNTTTFYRCAAGYYGTTSNGTSGCTKCPSNGTTAGMSDAGADELSDCYIPEGSYSDTTGKYVFNCDCKYNGTNSCTSGSSSSSAA